MREVYPDQRNKFSGFSILNILEHKVLSMRENEIIYQTLGQYATLPQNQYLEIVSEGFTKFICDSLDGIKLIKDPIEQFKKCNNEFKAIFKKAIFLK